MPALPALFIFLQGVAQTPGMGQGQASGPGGWVLGIMIAVALGWALLTIWCILDAFTNNDNGCLWLMLMLSPLNPIVVPFYVFGKLYSQRSVSRRQQSLTGRSEEDSDITRRFASEFERAKFIEASMKGGGTMYEPGLLVQRRPEGAQHFKDERAELLLSEQRYEDAWDYLIDLLGLARDDNDFEREETYRSYIARIPQGLARLTAWEAGGSGAAVEASGDPAQNASSALGGVQAPGLPDEITDSTAQGRGTRRRPGRDVPF